MKKILILGASGFIGNALYKELNSYYNTFGTYFTKKGFGQNHHFFHFDMEEGGLERIIKEVKPKLIHPPLLLDQIQCDWKVTFFLDFRRIDNDVV